MEKSQYNIQETSMYEASIAAYLEKERERKTATNGRKPENYSSTNPSNVREFFSKIFVNILGGKRG